MHNLETGRRAVLKLEASMLSSNIQMSEERLAMGTPVAAVTTAACTLICDYCRTSGLQRQRRSLSRTFGFLDT